MAAVHLFGIEFAAVLQKVFDDTFPRIDHSVCYGSKVFPQNTPSSKKPVAIATEQKGKSNKQEPSKLDALKQRLARSMFDCIFIVDDPRKWHAKNLLLNPGHYSLLMRYVGAKVITRLNGFGAGILYNPYINIQWNRYDARIHSDLQLKYGVIATSQLISDLLYWDSCYIAGRLHKPTVMVHDETNCIQYSSDLMSPYHAAAGSQTLSQKLQEIYDRSRQSTVRRNPSQIALNDALLLNWDFAVRIALLLLVCHKSENGETHKFTIDELLYKIVMISYFGDDRMKFGEDKRKIEKIVNGAKQQLLHIYMPFFDQYIKGCDGDYYQCTRSIEELIQRLPQNVINEINEHDRSLFVVGENRPRYEEWLELAIAESLSNIIKRSSRKQVLKSFVTTDWNKIAFYFMQKVYKQILSYT